MPQYYSMSQEDKEEVKTAEMDHFCFNCGEISKIKVTLPKPGTRKKVTVRCPLCHTESNLLVYANTMHENFIDSLFNLKTYRVASLCFILIILLASAFIYERSLNGLAIFWALMAVLFFMLNWLNERSRERARGKDFDLWFDKKMHQPKNKPQ